jgi:LuxR family transcriptional regulator, maltose regulon positive regulatory protein
VPGAGKSVALRSWLQDRPELRSVWLSCDARDADPPTFWLALGAALARAWPDRWLDVVDLLSEREPDLDDVAIAVVNDLADLGEPVVLVIDDFQFAAAAAPSVITLIERLPAGCRVVVGTRTEPQLALHRLRAHGQLLEVRDRELRLTPAEVAAVLREFEVELNETDVELLATSTEGWMAGVQMAAVSLRDQSDPDHFLTELAKTPRAITDFLGTEVLDRQPFEIREFLLTTSILDMLDAESCQAVTERRDTDALLDKVAERNLFLIELDRGTYRYHHLFADLLRHRLRAADPDRERALHRRAAAFFVQTGDPENAIGHLLAAGQDAEAFDVLQSGMFRAFYQGDGRMPRRLVAKIESHATVEPARMPDLALALAASGPDGEAEQWIRRASEHATDLGDAGRARLAVAQALVGLRNGEPQDIERALSPYCRAGDLPDEARFGSVESMLARGRLWLGDLQGARKIFEQTLRTAEEPSAKQITMASGLAWVACVEGQLTEAEQVAGRSLAGAELIGFAGHPIMADAFRAQGRVAFERGDLVAAERLVEQSISMSEDVRPALAVVSQLSLSRVWLADGRVGEAIDGIAHARARLPSASTSPLLGLCHALEGRIATAIGDLDRAEACARKLAQGHRASTLQARIAIARGELDRACEALARCEPATLRERLDVAVLTARIAHGRKSDDADATLAAALALARVEGFVVAVTDDMVDLRSRLALLLRSGRIGSYEQAVLDRLEASLLVVGADDTMAGPLSDRELTVLRYLASRLTNKEIAAEIFVSTNTLKTHVKRVYRKLGVSSRTEAVAEGRRQGLLYRPSGSGVEPSGQRSKVTGPR